MVQQDKFPLTDVVLVVHGGAGEIRREGLTPERDAACREGLRDALLHGGAALQAGGSAVDAVCAAVCCLEDNPLFNAGRGADLNFDGVTEMDASVMEGAAGDAGAAAGVRTVRNPVLLARAIKDHSPYVLLAGTGADEFARAQGLVQADASYFITPEREQRWQDWKRRQETEPVAKFGTVGAVACDSHGSLAAATSTGGMAGKRYSRIGDSPIIGAGTWAANATCAVSATGHGEYFIRYAVAHDIHARIAYGGASLADAAHAAIHETLPTAGGAGGVIALDAHGNAALSFNTPGMYRGVLRSDGSMHVGIYNDEQ